MLSACWRNSDHFVLPVSTTRAIGVRSRSKKCSRGSTRERCVRARAGAAGYLRPQLSLLADGNVPAMRPGGSEVHADTELARARHVGVPGGARGFTEARRVHLGHVVAVILAIEQVERLGEAGDADAAHRDAL